MGSVIDDYPASAQCSVRVSKLPGGESVKIGVTGAVDTVWAFWGADGQGNCSFSRVIGLPSLRLCARTMHFTAPDRTGAFNTEADADVSAQPGPAIPIFYADLYLWGKKLNGGGKRQITLKCSDSQTAIVEFSFGDGGDNPVWVPVTSNGTVIDWP